MVKQIADNQNYLQFNNKIFITCLVADGPCQAHLLESVLLQTVVATSTLSSLTPLPLEICKFIEEIRSFFFLLLRLLLPPLFALRDGINQPDTLVEHSVF